MNNRTLSLFMVLVIILALFSGSFARPKDLRDRASKGQKDPELNSNDEEEGVERRGGA